MARRRHSAEEIIRKLRQADVELGKRNTVAGVCRLLGVTDPAYSAGGRSKAGSRSIN